MAVHQLKDGRWYIEYRRPSDSKKVREYFGRGLEAEVAARDRFGQLDVRVHVTDAGGPPFIDVVRAYLNDKAQSLTDTTLAGMVPKIKAVYLPLLGHILATSITEARIRQYIDERLKVVKRTTVHRELSDIRAILNWAVKKRIIMSNNMAGATWPRRDDERIRPPAQEEIKAILTHAQPHLYRALVLAWYCGMRVGEELFSRRWQDVDWDSQTFFVISAQKGGLDTRRVPIATELIPKLLQWYIEDGEKSDLHIIRWHGKRVRTLKTAWKRAKQRAGITRRLRPYDLRHNFGSSLIDSGVDPQTVGNMMGHKDKSTTMYVYRHVTDEGQRRAVEKIKSIF
jgi:integrase